MGKPSQLDSWVEQELKKTKCTTCRGPFKEKLQEILKTIIKHKAFKITKRQMFEKLKEECPDYDVHYKTFEVHVCFHEAALWNQAKGRV